MVPCALISAMIVEDLLGQDRREAHRRLVEEQDRRARHERAAHGQHLLLATRQRSGLLAAPLLQAREEVEDARDVVVDLLAARG